MSGGPSPSSRQPLRRGPQVRLPRRGVVATGVGHRPDDGRRPQVLAVAAQVLWVEASRYYAARTLLGLKALHDRDFVYRDVKPENMLVDEHGRVRLSDLGFKCAACGLVRKSTSEEPASPRRRAVRVALDVASNHAGALRAQGRERHAGLHGARDVEGEVHDHRVDYFSLGCMVVEFVVGVCPFRTRDAAHWGGRKKKKKEEAIVIRRTRALRKQAKIDATPLANIHTGRGPRWRWRRT